MKQEIVRPILQETDSEKIVFERILGHPEIPDSHRWVENFGPNCHICNKHTYTIFVWNKDAAARQLRASQDQAKRGELQMQRYSQSNLEPITLHESYSMPILAIGEQVHKLLPLVEFIERLNEAGIAAVRNCDNEIEEARY